MADREHTDSPLEGSTYVPTPYRVGHGDGSSHE